MRFMKLALSFAEFLSVLFHPLFSPFPSQDADASAPKRSDEHAETRVCNAIDFFSVN